MLLWPSGAVNAPTQCVVKDLSKDEWTVNRNLSMSNFVTLPPSLTLGTSLHSTSISHMSISHDVRPAHA